MATSQTDMVKTDENVTLNRKWYGYKPNDT